MRRYPTAAEVERMAEALGSRPRLARDLARETRMAPRHAAGALKALAYQRRAVRYRRQGWTARRGCE